MKTSKAIIERRPLWLLSLLVPVFPFASYLLVTLTGNSFFWWLSIIYALLLIPLLDFLIGESETNPNAEDTDGLHDEPFYRRIVYMYPALQWLALGFGIWVASSGVLSGWDWIAWTLTFGNIGAYAINAAHEMGHKRGKLPQLLAKLTLMPVCYGHFLVEHNRGHHVRVATPEDPASAKLGESFWRFLPRTVIGGMLSAWQLEKKKLQRKQLPSWHWSNENLQGWAGSLLLLIIAIAAGGWWVGLWFIAQAMHGASLLEVVNYVEHYGLKRQKLENGRYEKCSPSHSWNSNTIYSNITLFQLQRHSDHHANPTRPYQILRHFDESPQLPSGYSAMITLAYIPPLWFRHMDKRVLAHYNGDRSLANEYSKEDKLQLPNRESLVAAIHRAIQQFRQQLQGLFD